MPELSRERWLTLSPHLERALDMTPDARHRWLDQLDLSDSTMAADLRALLAEHEALDARGFLADPVDPARVVGAPLAGQAIGPYTLDALIGHGGMGAVWKAHRHDGRYEGTVAVKFLSPALVTAVGTERFTREGSILARLTHPAIAHLVDAGVTPAGQPYLVLNYVDGVTIDRYVEDGGLGLDARLVLVQQVLDAVAHAHANLVVHRDLKPSNILVRPDGRVTLLDFGIAKLVSGEGTPAAPLTFEGGSAMTPEYAAPEQISGGAVTTRTDVYALGVVLYRLLSGRHPHEDAIRSPIDLFNAIAGTDPPPMSRVARTPFARALAGDLDIIVAKALCKPPEERYDSVRALAEDLARYARGEPVSARPPSAAYRTRKWLGRNRALAALAAFAVLATLTGLGLAVWQAREASRERDVAQRERDRALRAHDNSEAATEFFNFLLTDAGPVDAPITVDALMKRSDALLNGQFSTNTEHQASILNVQASYYLSTLNLVEGRARATRAAAIAREAGDIELLAAALCLQGAAEVLAGARAEGTRLIDEALGLQGLSAKNRVSCHLQRSYIARNSDDGATALRNVQAALDIVRQDGRISRRTEAIVYSDLGYAEQLLGRIGDADRSFAKAMEIMTAIGQEHSTAAGTMLNNWGIAAQSSGDTLRARDLIERALEAAKQRDRESSPPIALVVNFARLQLQTGRFDEARRLYSEAAALARHQGSGLSEAYALNGLGMVAAERHELDAAERYLAQTRALTDAMPPGTPAITNADLLEGQIALARGRVDVAAATFTRLRGVYDALPPNAAAAGIRLYLAEVALESGRAGEAATLAEDAVGRHRALQGGLPYSRGVGLGLYALARARQAQGRRAEALSAATEGAEHLKHAIGTEHPSFTRLVELQASLRAGS